MPLTVNDIYTRVCDEVCEPNGPQLGLITRDDLFRFINVTVKEFSYTSGLFRGLFCVPAIYGVSVYNQPDYSTGVQQAFFDNTTMFESNTFIWDQTDSTWRLEQFGFPNEWREDNIGVLTLDVKPKPNVNGVPFVTEGSGFYGVISDIEYPDQYTFLADPLGGGLYGTVALCDTSEVFMDSTGGMFGTVGDAGGSIGNIMGVTLNNQHATLSELTDYLVNIPSSFGMIIIAGVLMRVFNMDGELKSPELSNYWMKFYQDGLNYLRSVAGMMQIGEGK